MKLETINMGGYNLHLIKTNKFKTISIDVKFYRNVKKEEIIKRNLLKMILIDSNNDYKTERDLIVESENLYDIRISSSVFRRGNLSTISFSTRFLNEKYTEEGMNEESIKFFLSLIFNPLVKNNEFVNFDKQKNKLRQQILSIKDNKPRYSILKTFEKIDNRAYSYNPYGSLEELDNIGSNDIYNYYKDVLKEDSIDVFILGDFDSEKIKEIFKEYFKINTFKKEKRNILVEELKPLKKENKYIEYDNVNQVQLVILYSLNGLTEFERNYTIKLFSEILGGSSNSILFDIVREKNNYCYYINSSVMPYDNIMIINSGIEGDSTDKCIKLIKKCIKDITSGHLSLDNINSSKKVIESAIKSTYDDPTTIISSYFSKVLVGTDLEKEKIDKFNSITKEDIIKVSKKINLNTIYTLENNGGKDGEN